MAQAGQRGRRAHLGNGKGRFRAGFALRAHVCVCMFSVLLFSLSHQPSGAEAEVITSPQPDTSFHVAAEAFLFTDVVAPFEPRTPPSSLVCAHVFMSFYVDVLTKCELLVWVYFNFCETHWSGISFSCSLPPVTPHPLLLFPHPPPPFTPWLLCRAGAPHF